MPAWAFVAEPQTHGEAERSDLTQEEQAISGQSFRTP